MERTSNGFEVAEADWELRGPGDLLGTAQSGLPALKIGNLKTDAHLMRRARAAAISIFQTDPRLESPDNQRFRRLIVEQRGRIFLTLANEKFREIFAVCPAGQRGNFFALRLSPEAWRPEITFQQTPEKYTLASSPSVDPKQVASLEALNRERRALVNSVIPSVVAVKTSKKFGIRREYGLIRSSFSFGNRAAISQSTRRCAGAEFAGLRRDRDE